MKRVFSRQDSVAIAATYAQQNEAAATHEGKLLEKVLLVLAIGLVLVLGLPLSAIADHRDASQDVAQTAEPTAQPNLEIDGSVSRDYEPAVVYLPDPQTQRLIPTSVLVVADEPVAGAVDQIMQAYEGQDIGIQGYAVDVDATDHEAMINFDINNPRGAAAFQSLSSANQYSLFEAIRETLLTQPSYDIEQVIFMANGSSFDI